MVEANNDQSHEQYVANYIKLIEDSINNGDVQNAVNYSINFIESNIPCRLNFVNSTILNEEALKSMNVQVKTQANLNSEVSIARPIIQPPPQEGKQVLNKKLFDELTKGKGVPKEKAKYGATGTNTMAEALEKIKTYKP